ncbi:MAG: PP2C family serine/threonine-protein phosphatase [Candidatus Promineifilaceae bacterium]|nr:PP2C family serine/threonine-protein phosphatase [Candidatus Promineifilaceae bacterium]
MMNQQDEMGEPQEEKIVDDPLADETGLETAEITAPIEEQATRPLRPQLDETMIASGPPKAEAPSGQDWLQAAQRCNIGRVRTRNEDSTFVFEAHSGGQEPLLSFGLYVVADGMGGHHAGHEASRNAARIVARLVLERIYLPLLRHLDGGRWSPPEPIRDVMLDAVQEANRTIHNEDPEKDGGTTLTAALVFGRRLYIVHVGDSRAYLLDGGELKQITTDHSYVRRLMDAGQLTAEEAAVHPQRNMLYKAVGAGGALEIDTFTQVLPRQGKLLLCSDGLWGLVSDAAIRGVLNGARNIQGAADELVDLALKGGGHDNITVIVVDFKFSEEG